MNIWKQFATTVIRWLLTLISAWLIRKGVISESDASVWIPEMALGIVTALVPLLWALWTRIQHRVGFLTALELPANAHPLDVKDAVAELTTTEKIVKALENK